MGTTRRRRSPPCAPQPRPSTSRASPDEHPTESLRWRSTIPQGPCMTFFQAIILGIVQGLTEFLPISSTAHLRIVPAFAGWEDPGAAFTAIVQLGTMLAVLLF